MVVNTSTRDRVRRVAPWWAKIGLKLFFAKVPLAYSVLRRMGLVRHGGMQRPQYAFDTFRRHFDSVQFKKQPAGFTMLELGPGDSAFSTLIAYAYGATSVTLVDAGPFASADVALYRRMADYLREKGLDAPDLSGARCFEDVLKMCNARYETDGLASLRSLPAKSFDFVFSNSVIQGIRREEVAPTLFEIRRLLSAGGVSVHSVDLRDTVGGSLQHLRFSARTWESAWCRSASFYTNRLRTSELLHMARLAGFDARLDEVNAWPSLPIPRHKLDAQFRAMSDEDLRIATIRVVMLPQTRPGPSTTVNRQALLKTMSTS